MVDLVRDHPDPPSVAEPRQRLQRGPRQHGPGRVGRARDDQALDRLVERLQHRHGRLKAGLRRGGEQHRLQAERLQRVAVGGIAGIGQRHPVADVERGEEGEHEPGGPPGRDHDALDRRGEVVTLSIVGGAARAQRQHAMGLGVADRTAGQGGLRRVEDGLRRARAGLAGLHVKDPRTLRLTPGGGLEYLHREEGRDRGAPGRRHPPRPRGSRPRRCRSRGDRSRSGSFRVRAAGRPGNGSH